MFHTVPCMRVLNKLVADSSQWSVTLQNILMLLLKICIVHSWFYMYLFYRRREEYYVHISKHPSLSQNTPLCIIFSVLFLGFEYMDWSNMVFHVWKTCSTLRFGRIWKSCAALPVSSCFLRIPHSPKLPLMFLNKLWLSRNTEHFFYFLNTSIFKY